MEDNQSSNVDQLALERDRLNFERQKFAIEVRLKRRELAKGGKSWKELLANPLTLAIVGGFITVMSTVITTSYTANENRRSEEERAKQARASEDLRAKYASDSAKHALQAELIKKFVEAPRTETVRENLKFLVKSGLLPDYAAGIEKYLQENPGAPAVGNTLLDTPVVRELREQIVAKKILFENPALQEQLLGLNSGVTPKLQLLVLKLSELASPIRISSIMRTATGDAHGMGRAVDIGNEEIATTLLPKVATQHMVDLLGIDEIIFDAGVVGEPNRNKWNFDQGKPHNHNEVTLSYHRNAIHFAVK